MLRQPETWVAVAFILFVILMIYLKVPAMVAKMLDERSAKIAAELSEARKLRLEAQALLDSYKTKRAEAETDAANIVTQAKREAEAQAIKEVRATATDLAVAAATGLLAVTAKGPKGEALIAESIAAVKARLN